MAADEAGGVDLDVQSGACLTSDVQHRLGFGQMMLAAPVVFRRPFQVKRINSARLISHEKPAKSHQGWSRRCQADRDHDVNSLHLDRLGPRRFVKLALLPPRRVEQRA